jgi:hypothetical protein
MAVHYTPINRPKSIPKIVLIAVALVVCFAVALTAGIVYVVHRAGQKAAGIEAKTNIGKSVTDFTAAANTAMENAKRQAESASNRSPYIESVLS